MALPKGKISKARKHSRRANWKLTLPGIGKCPQCGQMKLSHRVCKNCGYYNGVQVIVSKDEETDPSEDGVGIAGPQVGISRRIVAVQRFDKPGEPFEVYPNVRIVGRRGELCSGPEGCLSVPGRRGNVLRYRDIDIQYTLIPSSAYADGASATSNGARVSGALRDTTERIQGFTAVIFQHECDHLDGVLYIDKLEPGL